MKVTLNSNITRGGKCAYGLLNNENFLETNNLMYIITG